MVGWMPRLNVHDPTRNWPASSTEQPLSGPDRARRERHAGGVELDRQTGAAIVVDAGRPAVEADVRDAVRRDLRAELTGAGGRRHRDDHCHEHDAENPLHATQIDGDLGRAEIVRGSLTPSLWNASAWSASPTRASARCTTPSPVAVRSPRRTPSPPRTPTSASPRCPTSGSTAWRR